MGLANTNEIQRIEPAAPASNAITPYEMVAQAVVNGAPVETVEKLLALHERWEANRARKAFDAAMSDAKAEIPPIAKNRQVEFESKRGGSSTNYRFEDLAEIARTVDPILAKHGLSYRFQTHQDNKSVRVTCVISHRDGHSESNSLMAGEDHSGNKNSIQAIGSAVTYLQRYTLKASLGLSASFDDDGNSVTPPARQADSAPIRDRAPRRQEETPFDDEPGRPARRMPSPDLGSTAWQAEIDYCVTQSDLRALKYTEEFKLAWEGMTPAEKDHIKIMFADRARALPVDDILTAG